MTACPSCSAALGQPTPFCPQCGAAADPAGLPTSTSPAPARDRATPPAPTPTPISDSFDHGRFTPGSMLGDRYRIVGLLGRGGMGEVYRADDLKLGQPVALKLLPLDVERDPIRLDRFLGEVRTARQISHPNVCRVYDIGEVDGRKFLSMEYVDGEDLRSLLRRIGHLPEDKGLQIARQICAGLAAIHDRDVLHRDLKPANVMLDGQGRVRLTDFGLATAVVGAGGDGEIAGTPAYMAPEQLAGEPLSVQTDLYALGLLIFELFTGDRVNKSDGAKQTPTAALSASPGTRLDPAVQRVVERCLERDPRRRPASAVAVAAALPGGDPLAAALAAGETPSPQMVAAAGGEGRLAPTIAVPLLLGLVIAIALTAWLDGRTRYTARVPFPHSPEVLATKAREVLGRLGYVEPPADSASGFTRTADYSVWVNEHDKSADRWRHLAVIRPPMTTFWYRASPRAMVAEKFFGGVGGGGVPVTMGDPPLTTPGMTVVELSPDGRLVGLRVVPPEKDTSGPPKEPIWARLFEEASLDFAAFAPATPEWLAPTYADVRAAWVGKGADGAGAELRVEAAAYHGRPVFFRLVGPWTRPASTPRTPPTAGMRVTGIVLISLLLAVCVTAVALSIRSSRLGRADHRGGSRLAVAAGLIVLTSAALTTHFVADVTSDIRTSFMVASWACFYALLVWTAYVAIEPHVRRRWPQVLIAWSRLLDGRWRDPLVGRGLLVGSLIGLVMNLCEAAERLVLQWRGAPPSLTFTGMAAWGGIPSSVAVLLAELQAGALLSLVFLVLLVMLRIVLRGERAAAIGFVLILSVPDILSTTDDVLLHIPFAILSSAALVLVATRLGLVALVASQFVFTIGYSLNVGVPFPSFLTGTVMLGLAAMLVPGIFGFWTSVAGRKAAGARWLDD